MLTLSLLLALHATSANLQARQTAPARTVDLSTKGCPGFRLDPEGLQVERCIVLESGELAVVDGDRYVYTRYCIEVKELTALPCTDSGGHSHAATVSVRRRGETTLRLVTTTFAPSGQIRRPSIVANRYGHILELPTILAVSCDCNASRYFLKRRGSRQWRELDFQSWSDELARQLPEGLSNSDTPWPDLAAMRITGALWLPSDAHAGPNGGWFSGELAIEANRFVLRSLQVTRGDVKAIGAVPMRWPPEP